MLEHFFGKDGFVWWEGVVENRHDPLRVGRVKVRIFGWHTDDIDMLPTADLPWALVSYPPGATAPTPPREGTWCWGFFRDGAVAQEPILVGTFFGIPKPNTEP
jgi:hypothetical protein